MAKSFEITTTATDTLKTDAKGHAEAVFTVTNKTSRPVRGMASAQALESTKQEWLKITGETDRDFAPGGTQQFVVTFDAPVTTPPAGAPKPAGPTTPPATGPATADQYSFRLSVASATNPDEDFTEGPVVKVELPKPKEEKVAKKFPKWIFIPIAAVVLIGIGAGLYFALRKKTVEVPNVVGMTLEEAQSTLTAKNLTPVQQEVQVTGKVPVGQVIDQDPKPDSSPVPKGSEVRLTTEGEEPKVEVPDVVKQMKNDAEARLKEAHLEFVEKSTDLAAGLQPNEVVSQTPEKGARVKAGSTVELVIAVQKKIAVPDVRFRPLNLAQQQITAAGLKVVVKDPELGGPGVAPGQVKTQNPAPGVEVVPDSVVELVPAAQSTTVPDLRGKTIGAAGLLLQGQGLELGNISGTVNQDNVNTVLITSSDPVQNSPVARGSKVNVSVPQQCRFIRCAILVNDSKLLMRDVPTLRQFQIKQP